MGMFDYIRTKMPLPSDPPPPDIEWFQTKDTEEISGRLYMEKWTIEADGRLIHHTGDYSLEPDESKDGFHKWAGALKLKNKRDVVHPYHGDIGFGHYDTKTGQDWDYVARFTEGVCTKIFLTTD